MFSLYNDLSIALYQELKDGKTITTLNEQREEIITFLQEYGRIKLREDSILLRSS